MTDAKTELTEFQLGKMRELYETKAHGVNYHDELRLLDEHAALKARVAHLERMDDGGTKLCTEQDRRIAELESALALATQAIAKCEGLAQAEQNIISAAEDLCRRHNFEAPEDEPQLKRLIGAVILNDEADESRREAAKKASGT
jgi:hypothetical protein